MMVSVFVYLILLFDTGINFLYEQIIGIRILIWIRIVYLYPVHRIEAIGVMTWMLFFCLERHDDDGRD